MTNVLIRSNLLIFFVFCGSEIIVVLSPACQLVGQLSVNRGVGGWMCSSLATWWSWSLNPWHCLSMRINLRALINILITLLLLLVLDELNQRFNSVSLVCGKMWFAFSLWHFRDQAIHQQNNRQIYHWWKSVQPSLNSLQLWKVKMWDFRMILLTCTFQPSQVSQWSSVQL